MMSEREGAKPLVLTMGEPAGIGPDVTLAVWR
jgi:4-hydroxythreonine-4-phosphate dehydrogenase